MPAAAVTPAPIAYIKVVAVKKLVVGCLSSAGRRRSESRAFFGDLGARAVKKLDSLNGRTTSPESCEPFAFFQTGGEQFSSGRGATEAAAIHRDGVPFTGCLGRPATFTLNKLECSKQVYPNA